MRGCWAKPQAWLKSHVTKNLYWLTLSSNLNKLLVDWRGAPQQSPVTVLIRHSNGLDSGPRRHSEARPNSPTKSDCRRALLIYLVATIA
jgi:hypothetical protein